MKVIIKEATEIKTKIIDKIENRDISILYFYLEKRNVNFINEYFKDVIRININRNKVSKLNYYGYVICFKDIFSVDDYKKMIKIINKITFGKNIGYLYGNKKILAIIPEDIDEYYEKELIKVFYALEINNLKERYEYIYDSICMELDNEFIKNNFCDFKDNKCIANRLGKAKHEEMGCCYSFRYSKSPFELITDVKICEYLENKSCSTSCITCKLFTCKYLREQGIKFDINKFILSSFFTRKQIDVLTDNFFKKKEDIINKLLRVKDDKQLYCMYYVKNTCKVE